MRLPPRLPDAPRGGVQEQWRVALNPVPGSLDLWWCHCWRCNWMSDPAYWVDVFRARMEHTCPPPPPDPLEDDGR